MKILSILSFLIASGFLSTCGSGDGVQEPAQAEANILLGIWEHREFVDSLDHWVVESFQFLNDSTYQIAITVRETADGPDLGYRFLTTASYQLDGKTFEYYFSMVKDLPLGVGELPLYVSREELEDSVIDFFRTPKAEFTWVEPLKSFDLLDECLEDYPKCPEVKNFIKVS